MPRKAKNGDMDKIMVIKGIVESVTKEEMTNIIKSTLKEKFSSEETQKLIDKRVNELFNERIVKSIKHQIDGTVTSVLQQKFALGYYTKNKYDLDEVSLYAKSHAQRDIFESTETMAHGMSEIR